ncbi:Protein CHAPERONE-LIKE PROTEIN OF POR1 [Cardamine amara subsp. amara]|uniref:Protein CHAPERONE-LIKE PROTEIN OF POR1 n=1 Tax=Cardamine amara subsp. amara TaxID=228776 RepID=A0ABD1AN88_CARAN
MATAALSARPNRLSSASSDIPLHPLYLPTKLQSLFFPTQPWRSAAILLPTRRRCTAPRASSRADDSPPFDMSVETALKVLGVSEGASFDEILRAKKSIIASRKDDPNAISQAEAAYDMLLMQSLNQRRAGKVVSNNIRYADVKSTNPLGTSQWMKNLPVSIDIPSTSDLGIQAGVYGVMMVLTYVNGSSLESSGMPYAGADVPGLILATSFGASLYFMTKKNVKLGKAAALTAGGLVAGAVVGSAVETWLHVDVVPFLGLHSPAAVVSEFIVFSQFLVSLCLR